MPAKATCKAKDCAHEVVGKGYCRKHYRLWKAGDMPKARYKTCTEEKCRKRRFRASLCEEHYNAAHAKKSEPAAAKAAAATPGPAAPAEAAGA